MKRIIQFLLSILFISIGLYSFGTTCVNATLVPSSPTFPYVSTLVCGTSNDINGTTATACGNSSYLIGKESLYAWTPSISYADVSFAYTGQTWTGIFLYQGCPTSGGICIGNFTSSAGSKTLAYVGTNLTSGTKISLTAGVTYYLVIDTWPTPDSPCPGTITINASLPPSCLAPTALTVSNLTATSASIAWTAPAPAPSSGYQWEVRTSGAAGSGATGLAAYASTAAVTATVSGLTSATNYNLYVRSNCGGAGYSSWAGPQAFATPCDPVTLVSEGFENATFPPTCWSLAGTSAWLRTNLASGNGSGSASIVANFYSISSSVPFDIITPPFNISSARLSFDHAYAAYETEVDKLVIFYSTNGGSTYTQLIELLGGPTGPLNTGGATSSSFIPTAAQWASKFYDLPAGTNMVKFQAISAWGNNLFIDNIRISQSYPIDLRLAGISQTSGINPSALPMNLLPSSKSDTQLPLFLELDPNATGTATSENSHIDLYPDAESRSPKLLTAIDVNVKVDNMGLNPATYTLNWTVGGVAQAPYSGAQVSPGTQANVALSYTPTARGTFMATGTLDVLGDGFLSNNTNQSRIRVYPESFARTTYDNGTNIPSTTAGFNNPALQMIAAVRFTAPNNFTKLQGVDFYCRTENITSGAFIVEVREPGATTTAPGAVFYTKQYTDPAYFAAGGDMIHFAFDDNFPSIAAGTEYWITITSPLGILFSGGAQSLTTGRSFYSSNGTAWTALALGDPATSHSWMMRSVHVVGNPLAPCATPAKPTNLVLTPGTFSISGTFTSSGSTGNVVVRSTSPTLTEVPQNGTAYSAGSTLGNGTVVYAGTTTTSFTASSLTHGTKYYFFVFPYNSGFLCGNAYNTNTPLDGSATTLPAAPNTFTALPLGPSQIGFTATANSLVHNIMIAFSTESSTAFGTPTALYPIGSTIPGGGVVHYIGPANEAYNHNSLTENTTYHYRAWSIVPGPIYSATSLLSTVTTPCQPTSSFPVVENFNSTLFPSCWTQSFSGGVTTNRWDVNNSSNASGQPNEMRASYVSSSGISRLISPTLNLSAFSNARVRFKHFYDDFGVGVTIKVQTSNDLINWIDESFSYASGAGNTSGEVTVNLTTLSSSTYIAWVIDGNHFQFDYWYIDDVKIEQTPTEPIFSVSPLQKDFGSQSIFSASTPQTFTFSNNGIGTISISSISLTGADASHFTLNQQNTLPILLGPDQIATVSVTFAPGTAGAKTAQLVITDNLSSKALRSLPLTGLGVDPTITTIPYVESFDGTAFAPMGWKNTRTAGTGVPGVWERVTTGSSPTTSPKSGPAMARFNSFSFTSGTKAELITPPINLPEGNFRVSFWMNRDAGLPTTPDKVNVYFNTTNNLTNATLLGTVHRSMSLEPVVTTAGWHANSFFLPAEATGNGRYIILEAISAYGNNIFIDDFSISSPMEVTHTASNLSCFESNDGSIALTVEGGIPPLTITWKKDDELMESTSLVLEQLSAAVYEYTVKEATGIPKTELVTLTQPAAIPVATVTNTTVTYDGTVKTLNAVAPAGTTLVWYTQAEGGTAVAAPAKTDVGVYNYWVAAKSNLTDCQSLRVGAVLTINKKSLTVKADDKSKCQFTDLPLLTLTYTGFVPGEGPAQLNTIPVATTTALPNSPIGTYPITVGGGISNNYSFVYQSGTLTVVRTPMVSAGGAGFVCVSEVFPIVAATATNYTSLVWTTSGNGTFSNANILNPIYTPGSLDIANGNATLTLTADPGSYCSDFDQMVLNIQNDLPVSVSITQVDTEICLAEPVTFNAVAENGGLAPVFQWKVNGQNSGTNSSIFTYLPLDGDVVTVLLTTSISCALNNTALSNAITIDVTPDLTAGVMISTPSNAVCDFTPTSFTASPVNGGVSPAYQWKVNGNNVGTNAAQYTYVPLNGDLVSVVLTSSHSCAVVPVATSNNIEMSVAPPFLELAANPTKGGTVSGEGNYPDGTEVTITATAAAGWEFLNWKDMNGSIVSTEAVTIFTINECYEKLTATFSSTAKIAGQLKYFNNDETIIPSPNNNGVFYVQLFENGVALSPRQLVAHSLEVGLDSYYEFTGVESGKDYSIRIWEEAANGTLASTWSWNNWGGATAADAFIISWMANMDPQLAVFPWIWPAGATQLTPYSMELADVNNNQMIANSDALAVLYRLLAEPGSLPFEGGAHNFALATTKLDDHLSKAHPVAPEKLFTQHGVYTAAVSAPSVYQEVLLANISDGLNIYNIYFTATGDLNTSYTPEAESKQLAMLEYNGVINTNKGDEIMIPVRISQAAELGSLTLGLSYNNNVIEVLDVIGYDLYNIDQSNGTVKIAWYDLNGKFFANDQHLVMLKARLTGEISAGTRYLELLPVTELSDDNAMQLQNVTLKTDYIETASGTITDPELLSISHGIYPNPFNSVATIQYTLPESGKVRMAVYNQFGQLVKMLTDQVLQAGAHQVTVSNDDLNGAGTYFYQITLESDTNVNSVRGTIVLTK